MALKKDFRELDTRIDYYMNEVATRGGVVAISTAGSGVANDQSV